MAAEPNMDVKGLPKWVSYVALAATVLSQIATQVDRETWPPQLTMGITLAAGVTGMFARSIVAAWHADRRITITGLIVVIGAVCIYVGSEEQLMPYVGSWATWLGQIGIILITAGASMRRAEPSTEEEAPEASSEEIDQ